MIDIWMTITTATYLQIASVQNHEKPLALYFFYYKNAKLQATNQPWATIPFCSKGLGWSAPTVRNAKKVLEKLGLIKNVHASGRDGKGYIKLKYITESNTLENIFCTTKSLHSKKFDANALRKKDKCLKKKKRIINNSDVPNGTLNNGDKKVSKNFVKPVIVDRPTPKIVPKKKSPKAYYTHTTTDFRNYTEMKSHGATNHNKGTKSEVTCLDHLHALFANNCRDPYHSIYIPHQYGSFKWDMDILIEVFKYHLKHSSSPIKSIGTFIFCQGFSKNRKKMVRDDSKSWSPLLFWHQKMEKTTNGELTESGKKFLSSLKRSQVNGIEDIDTTVINKVAKSFYTIIPLYELMDGSERSMTYPFGIIDCMSKYIKEKTNKLNFKLVYITMDKFINEFLEVAIKRNIIKKKIVRRSI